MSTGWTFDLLHSALRFQVRWLMIGKVSGRFEKWSGKVQYDPKNPAASSAELEIDVSSVNTGIPDRDTHLKTADFFEVEKFPKITFRSTQVVMESEKRFRLTGPLTIRDVTREVTLDLLSLGILNDPWGKERAGFQLKMTVNRRDFGLTWDVVMQGGAEKAKQKVEVIVVGEQVDIEADIILTRE